MLLGGYFFHGLLPFIGSSMSPIILNLWIAACCLISAVAVSRQPTPAPKNKSLYGALLAFAVSFMLSTFFSTLPKDSAELMRYALPGVALCLLMAFSDRPKRLIYPIAAVFFFTLIVLTSTCLYLASPVIEVLDSHTFIALDIALLKVPNDILLFAIFWPFVAWCIDLTEQLCQKQKRLLGWGYLVLLTLLSILVGSRSTFFLTLGCVIFWVREAPKPSITLPLLASVILGGLLFFVSPEFVDKLLALPSSSQRLWIWFVGIKMLAPEDYLLGIGHGLFGVTFETARSYIETPDGLLSDPRRIGWAHNLFLEAWVERGLIGLVSLLWLHWVLMTRLRANAFEDPYHRTLLTTFLLLLVTACFELSFLRPWVCAAYGLLIGAVLGYSKNMGNAP